MKKIRTAPELYTHAFAIEREAAVCYAEFAERMADLGNDAVAELFRRLAGFESEHLEVSRCGVLGHTRRTCRPSTELACHRCCSGWRSRS